MNKPNIAYVYTLPPSELKRDCKPPKIITYDRAIEDIKRLSANDHENAIYCFDRGCTIGLGNSLYTIKLINN